MWKKFKIYLIQKISFGQKRPCVLRDFVPIGVFFAIEGGWGSLKIGDVVRVSKIDHQFFLLFFCVDLVQILQGVKNGPSSIWSCRTRQHDGVGNSNYTNTKLQHCLR